MKSLDSIARNAVLYALVTVCNYAFSFATVFYAARVLLPESLGRVAFASAVVSYFSMLAQMGIPLYGMRSVAACRDDAAKLVRLVIELIGLGLLLAAGASALLVISVLAVPKLAASSRLYAILGLGLLASGLGCDWLYKGLERYRFLLFRTVAVRLVVLALLVLLVRDEQDLYWYAALSTLSTAGCALVGFLGIPRAMREEGVRRDDLLRVRHVSDRRGLCGHVRPVMTFFLMSCATLVYANLDVVMLGFMGTPAEVGCYSVAAKAKVVLTTAGGIVWNAALPRATRLWEEGRRDEFVGLARRSLRLLCALQAVVTLLSFVFAEPVVLMVAGDAYLEAVPALRVLLLSVLPIAASNILGGQVLVPAGRERMLLASEVCGAVVNLAFNFALIPSMGSFGAAASTVAAEVVVMLGTYAFVRAGLHLPLFPWDEAVARTCRLALSLARRRWYRLTCGSHASGVAPGYCPCCDTPLPRWRAGGYADRPTLYDRRRYENTRQDVLCPVCGSLPRHRIIAWHLGRHLDLIRGKRILYFAPEQCMMRWFKAHKIDVVTADLYVSADLTIDIQDTGLADASYDVVVCNHVLEHVDDWKAALAEVRRVLTPGGLLVCSFPIDQKYETVYEDATVVTPEERVLHFGQHDHLRVFGQDSAELLEEAGFEVHVLRGSEMPERILSVVGPADYDAAVVFLCEKAG